MSEITEETPMFRQYREVKAKLAAGTLLLFRLGDFFELFDDDARIASNVLGLTLTARHQRPMAGLPAHALEGYLKRLLEAGHKVAVCDQLEVAQAGKLVKRELTRVYTPGTALSAEHLRAEHNQYILALWAQQGQLAASWMELSTGEWGVGVSSSVDDFLTYLTLLQPAELIVPEAHFPPGIKERLIEYLPSLSVSELPNSFFEIKSARQTLCEALKVATLKGLGLHDEHLGIAAAGALYSYACQALCAAPTHLRAPQLQALQYNLILDPNTARQLEVFESLERTAQGSLLHALRSTQTAAGGRLLERLLHAPECQLATLQARTNAVAALMSEPLLLKELRQALGLLRDLERILTRLQNRLKTPRELAAVRDTLRALPGLLVRLGQFAPAVDLSWITGAIDPHAELCGLLSQALEEEPSNDFSVGGYLRPGYDKELDHLKSLSANHKIWIAQLERTEQERTGIKSLKVKYNQNFGFFIEVTKANLARVPEDYIRRSTTVGGERFVTTALQERQREILGAEAHALRRELELFEALVARVVEQAGTLSTTAQALAWCDVLAAFAYNALKWNYVRPTLDTSTRLEIVAGRHPVVEQALVDCNEKFVSNDTRMSAQSEQIILLTGPNMAGKSTYIRQTALIVLMAQIGSFVPAQSAHIGLADRIFSRIGASDALSKGESTFMVEMTETAYILRHATERSLIILDEIGRGTSTYDGLSIAWSVAEHLHAHPGSTPGSGPRTLFATHYHELTRLEKTLPRLRNYTVMVKEYANKIVFVRQVVPGVADRSYGVHVAQLAGMPDAVVKRANELLQTLEAQAKAPKVKESKGDKKEETSQLGFWG